MFNNFIVFSQQQASLSGLRLEKPSFYRDFTLDSQLNGPGTIGALPSLTRIGPDISFTRSTSATYIDRNGNITLANINEPRFEWGDHRTNLLSASNDINSSGWEGYWAKAPEWRQDAVGPDGIANSAWSLPLSAARYGPGGIYTGILQGIQPLLLGIPLTVSLWARADDNSAFGISFGTTDGFTRDINGLATTNWQRFSYTSYYNPNAGSGPRGTQFVVTSGTNTNNNSKIYVYGFQCEVGSTATPYISTAWSAPVTVSAPKGLLIEEQRTNLVGQQNLYNWLQDGFPTLSAGSGIAGLSSYIVNDTTNNTYGQVLYVFPTALLSATTYCFSCYIKKNPNFNNSHPWLRIYSPRPDLGDALAYSGIFFNQATGQASLNSNHTTTTSAISVQDFGTYFRTSYTFNSMSTAVPTRIEIIPSHGFGVGATLSGTSIEVAGIQVEQGTFPSSYIPTAGNHVTRAADSATVTGNSFASLYNNKEGTLFAEFRREQTAGVANFLHFAGTSPNQIVLETNATSPSTLQRFLVETSAGAQANIGFTGVAANTVYRLIGAYAATSFQAAQNGTLGTEDTAGALPAVSQMSIGSGKYGTGSLFKTLNGHIRKVGYWPKRLSNTSLRALTLSSLGFAKYFAQDASLYTGTGPGVEVYRNSEATYFDSNGVLKIAGANKPRFNYDPVTKVCQGLLVEEARTNSIRNSQAGGSTNGVIGSGGVMPTNWTISGHNTNGVTTEILGTGTGRGTAYIDLKISGTTTATNTLTLGFESTTQIVAANGQTWTHSGYAKLQAGSATGASYRFIFGGRTVAGAQVVEQGAQTFFTPTTASLVSQRTSATGTYSNATVERALPMLWIAANSGVTLDLTLRIAAPQLEQGSFPTSYIPTTNAAVTRAEDIIQVNNNSFDTFYNPEQGTFYTRAVPLSGAQTAAILDIGNTYNSIHGIWKSGPGGDGSVGTQWNVFTDATFLSANALLTPLTANFTSNLNAANSASYIAYSYGPGTFAASVSSSLMTQSTAVSALPSLEGFSYFNGHIQSIEYYNTRLTNQQLTALSN